MPSKHRQLHVRVSRRSFHQALVSTAMTQLLTSKHKKYFERNLVLFPAAFESYDSSHSSLVYFSVLGLALLNELPENRDEWIQWVWNRLVATKDGFRGSMSHKWPNDVSESVEPAHLDATYFSLCILAMFKETNIKSKLDIKATHQYIRKCQTSSGLFCAAASESGPIGEPSLRHSYSALSILKLLGISDPELEKNTADYVVSCQQYDGGFGDAPGQESHAGLVFCAVSSLGQDVFSQSQVERAVEYLAHCQDDNGGFNGRPNKPTDVCYSFWVGASLANLGMIHTIDASKGIKYLLTTGQHEIIGGFSKVPGQFSDPLHSALGLCALAIFGHPELVELDSQFVIPKDSVLHTKTWF